MAEFYAVAQTKRKPGRPSKKKQAGEAKLCARCGEKRVLADFYANRRYEAGLYRDRWCKECAKEVCVNRQGLIEYLYHNNRAFKPGMWDEARKKAIGELAQNSEFVSDADSERKEKVIDQRAGQIALTLINAVAYYKFVDNEREGFGADLKEHSEAGRKADPSDPMYSTPVFSPEWGGSYTRYELQRMEGLLENIALTRGIEDDTGQSYARMFVKQQIMVDRLGAEMQSNPDKDTIERYNKAVSALNEIGKAGQISPAYKKQDVTAGLGSLGEFIRSAEYGRVLNTPMSFPPDQIDGIINDFRHIAQAIKGTGGLDDGNG